MLALPHQALEPVQSPVEKPNLARYTWRLLTLETLCSLLWKLCSFFSPQPESKDMRFCIFIEKIKEKALLVWPQERS